MRFKLPQLVLLNIVIQILFYKESMYELKYDYDGHKTQDFLPY
jgi:hypothetical protein